MISASKPKIAAYHFTTLTPNLGVVKLKDKRSFVMADLPGLIEGASTGTGLGIKFLKHAMRTKVLAHVIDMGSFEGRDPIKDYETIRKEIEAYSEKLSNKKEIVVANKMDLDGAKENLKLFKEKYKDVEIIEISAINNENVEKLINRLADVLESVENNPLYDEREFESHIIYKFKNEKPYTITNDNGVWILEGAEIEKLFKMTKFTEDEAVIRFGRKLKGMGVEEELERLGAKRGDEVQILDYIFVFKE